MTYRRIITFINLYPITNIMSLTPEQKTKLKEAIARLRIKEVELTDTRQTIRGVIRCAETILDDVPIDTSIREAMTDTRIMIFYDHVITKTEMLAPAK